MHLRQLTRLTLGTVVLLLALLVILLQPRTVHSQDAQTPAGVTLVAIGQANVRAGPAVTYDQVGTIMAGTTYRVIGRNARFPWLLISLPNTMGWVFKDLVTVTGDLNSVPYSDVVVDVTALAPSLTPQLTITLTPAASLETGSATDPAVIASQDAAQSTNQSGAQSAGPSLTPSLTATTVTGYNVFAEALDESNVRYGPGTDFPKVGSIQKGTKYPVVRRHTQFPWIEIAFDGTASRRGWVFNSTVRITGDIYSVPTVSGTAFSYPTLTPTAEMIVTSVPVWSTPLAPLAEPLTSLSATIYKSLLDAKFIPGTETQGSVFFLDLHTNQSFTLNPGLAYSGMSIIKIPLVISLFRKLNNLPDKNLANTIGQMLICSENSATNDLLSYMGNGNALSGAQYVTNTMQTLGLKDTLLLSSIYIPAPKGDPTSTPEIVSAVKTDVDQTSTDADPYNQSTPADFGWLLSALYHCADDGTGPLISTFPGEVTENECRQIMGVMRLDNIGALIQAGVPDGIQVAHKHGWVNDTHGDAGIVSTPGGDYVLVVMLHNKTWLNYNDSFPLIAEISRLTYNAYNPANPLDKTHTQPVPDCSTIPQDVITILQSPVMPPIR